MTTDIRKITISLPGDVVEFAGAEAERRSISRRRFIAEALSNVAAAQVERIAADGYRYYRAEAEEFAESSATAVAEAIGDGG